MNPLDACLQAACPVVMVPRYEELVLLAEDGHRFLAATDGLYMEVRRPWLHAILLVAASPMPLPYGEAPQVFKLHLHHATLAPALARFIEHARETSPKEAAAWVTFSPPDGALGYVLPEVIENSAGYIQYYRPAATASCLPMLDMHSHGAFPAFFSSTDETDDRNDDMKLAFVVGNLDQPEVTVAMRLVGLGVSQDLSEFAVRILDSTLVRTPHALRTSP